MKEKRQDRQTAVKTNIKKINEGKYVTEEGWKPNYLLTTEKEKISRANLLGIIVDKEKNENGTILALDDGSGKIVLRSFEEIKNIEEINIGDSVLIIGKIREYNNERYVSPEIIKKVERKWLEHRKRELCEKESEEVQEEPEPKEEEKSTNETDDLSINEKLMEIIKELDSGDGVLIEEIKEKVNLEQIDELLDKLLKEGEIFQNSPGKVKVL